MSTAPLQRVGPLAAMPGMLAEHGIDVAELLQHVGAPEDALADPENVIPYSILGQVLELAAEETRLPHFGLLLGARQDHRALGVIGRLMSNAPTVGDALFDFVSNQHRNSRGAVVYLTRQGENYIFGYAIYSRHSPGTKQIYDLCIALGGNMLRRLGGPDCLPLEVLVCHRPPVDVEPYRSTLKAPIFFNQTQTAFVLSPRVLGLRVVGADPEEHERLTAAVQAAISLGDLDFASHVRHVLKPLLLIGAASEARVAKRVGIHMRTLNRRLEEEGTSYRAVEQEVRQAIACELLEITDLQVSEISAALHYGTPSAFNRAFNRWRGTTPSAWRRGRAWQGGPKPILATGESASPA